ncbi:hypothetical protein RKD41_001545 [Streptomyces tendae]
MSTSPTTTSIWVPRTAFSWAGEPVCATRPRSHQRDVVGELVRLLQILRGQQYGRAGGGQLPHRLPDPAPARRVESRRGLVQEEHVGTADETRGQVEAAAHPAGVAGHRPVGGLGQTEAVQQLVGPLRRSAHPVQPGEQPQILAAGQITVHGGVLAGDADVTAYGRRVAEQIVPGDPGGAGVRPQQRGEQPYGGRLAGAVRPEEAADRARRYREVEPAQGVDLAEPFAQTFTKYSVRRSHGSTIAHYVRCT